MTSTRHDLLPRSIAGAAGVVCVGSVLSLLTSSQSLGFLMQSGAFGLACLAAGMFLAASAHRIGVYTSALAAIALGAISVFLRAAGVTLPGAAGQQEPIPGILSALAGVGLLAIVVRKPVRHLLPSAVALLLSAPLTIFVTRIGPLGPLFRPAPLSAIPAEVAAGFAAAAVGCLALGWRNRIRHGEIVIWSTTSIALTVALVAISLSQALHAQGRIVLGNTPALDKLILVSGVAGAALLVFIVFQTYMVWVRSRKLQRANAALNRSLAQINQAEADLRRSEQRFRTSVENLLDGFAVCSAVREGSGKIADFEIDYLNDAACALNKGSRAHLVGGRLLRVAPVHPDRTLFAEYCEVVETGKPMKRERVIYLNGDEERGIELAFEVRVAKLGDGFVAAWIDITARAIAERAKLRSEAKYRSLFEGVPVGLYRATDRGEILDANAALARMLGYPAATALRGTNTADLYADSADRVEHQHELEAKGVLLGAEIRLRRSDGELIWTRHTARALRNAVGDVLLYEGVIEDISAQRSAIEKLVQSEQRYRDLFEDAQDLVYTADLGGNLLSFNRASESVLGYSRSEALGMNFYELFISPERRATARESVERALGGGGGGQTIELEVIAKNGQRVTLEAAVRLQFTAGHPASIQAIARDITDRKRAELLLARQAEELARSNADLEQFAYAASHDLQEPLRMIRNFTELLAVRYRGKFDKDADEFMEFIVDGATRMQRLIQDLLAYARVSTRGKAIQPVDATRALDQALQNLRGRIDQTHAEVTHDPLPTVRADTTQLAQLFQNLLSNAMKFCADGAPRVHVGAEAQDNGWLFSIRDNGIGIPPEERDRIFNIFERGHREGDYPGTGIGLAIAKRIVTRHGGKIWVESQPGSGSTFFFSLPLRGEGGTEGDEARSASATR